MNRVMHFEIGVTDPRKTIAFYEGVFGWRIVKWNGPREYWLITTGEPDAPGINGGLFKSSEMVGTVNTIQVESVRDTIDAVAHHGGRVVSEVMTIPGVGQLAYCKDVEGTLFGIMEFERRKR